MLNNVKFRSEFLRNVLTLVAGTTIAQAISIAIVPILTRLYDPGDFGVYALYSASVSILSVVSTGRYELAIVQAKSRTEADGLVLASILISSAFSLLLLLILTVLADELQPIDSQGFAFWLYMIPISVFLTGVYQSLNYWLNREKLYKTMSVNRIINSSVAASGNAALGLVGVSYIGLIIGYLCGQIAAVISAFRIVSKNSFNLKKAPVVNVLRKFVRFPKYDLPASAMNIAAQQAPNLLLTPLFGAVTAGQYYLIHRVFTMPLTLISASVASVFRQVATERFHATGRFDNILIKTVCKLFLLAIGPAVVFSFYAVEFFVVLFGEQWHEAGKIARILVPMFVLKFVVSPVTYAFYIRRAMHYNVIGQFCYFVSMLVSIFIGYIERNFELTVYLISLSGVIIYITYLYVSWRLSR